MTDYKQLMTDYKQLCAELLSELENAIRVIYGEDGTRHISSADPVIAKADAALAEPEPEPPADGEVADLVLFLKDNAEDALADECPIVAGQFTRAADLLERLASPACLVVNPSPEAVQAVEALAARPLLERVAALGDCISAQTVGQVRALADRAAAWLAANPPGNPIAIEPRGCPTPGACSCVQPEPEGPTDEELRNIWETGHLPTEEELANDDGECDLQFLFTSAYYRWLEENPEAMAQHEAKCLRAVFNAGRNWPQPS